MKPLREDETVSFPVCPTCDMPVRIQHARDRCETCGWQPTPWQGKYWARGVPDTPVPSWSVEQGEAPGTLWLLYQGEGWQLTAGEGLELARALLRAAGYRKR